MSAIDVSLLGSTELVVDGNRHPLTAAKHRTLLGVLAMNAGRRVSTKALIDALWGDDPPAGATNTLQGYVADLRRALEPRRQSRQPARVLLTVPSGYLLQVEPDRVDTIRFERRVREAAQAMAVVPDPFRPYVAAAEIAEVERAIGLLDDAAADWRGEPFADVPPGLQVDAERERLRAILLEAGELRMTAALVLGRHAEVTTELERLARAHPWHERLWGLWSLALAGAGRQAEALAALREHTGALRDELGLDPTQALRELETRIVRQEAKLPGSGATDRRTGSIGVPGTAAAAEEDWPLFGRDAELDQARQLLELARTGRSQLAQITGEHGTGKSRLTRELARIASGNGFVVARVACREGTHDLPLWAWHKLTAHLDLAGPAQPADPAGLVGLAEGAAAALRAADVPSMLVLDDLQWSDEATLEVLDHLISELTGERVLVVLVQHVTTRPSSPAARRLLATLGRLHATRLHLDGLQSEAAGALLAAVSGIRPHPHLVERTRERLDGNPFLMIEAARDGAVAEDRLPRSVRTVVAHHLSRVPADTLELLRPASLLNRTWDADHLAYAADLGLGELIGRLRPAVVAGLLSEEVDDQYRFRHQVVREVLAAEAPRTERSRWHARFATVLAERTPLDRPDRRGAMVQHWRAAGYAFARPAWTSALEAARNALADERAGEAAELLDFAEETQRIDRDLTAADRRTLADLRRAAQPSAARDASSSDPLRTA